MDKMDYETDTTRFLKIKYIGNNSECSPMLRNFFQINYSLAVLLRSIIVKIKLTF